MTKMQQRQRAEAACAKKPPEKTRKLVAYAHFVQRQRSPQST
jgi:hypothetical protein